MLRSLICWWRGHDWPAYEKEAKKAKGKTTYFRCCRCGEPEAAYVEKDGTIRLSWG